MACRGTMCPFSHRLFPFPTVIFSFIFSNSSTSSYRPIFAFLWPRWSLLAYYERPYFLSPPHFPPTRLATFLYISASSCLGIHGDSIESLSHTTDCSLSTLKPSQLCTVRFLTIVEEMVLTKPPRTPPNPDNFPTLQLFILGS